MAPRRLIFRQHAVENMALRRVTVSEVSAVLDSGIVIEDYPNDWPYPSRLVLGWSGTRPLHVVAADNVQAQETIVITVYEPDPARWDSTFTQRSPGSHP